MKDIKRILVICRMVSHCGTAVHYGATLARQSGAELFVMNVIYNPFGIKGWNLPMPSLEKDYQKLLDKTKKDMHEIVSQETQRGITIKELIREGKPVDMIVKVIKEEKIDLLILTSHEESRLEHFLFGRDNEDLLRMMPCSILFVKDEPERIVDEKEGSEEAEKD